MSTPIDTLCYSFLRKQGYTVAVESVQTEINVSDDTCSSVGFLDTVVVDVLLFFSMNREHFVCRENCF